MDRWKDGGIEHGERRGERGAVLGMEALREVWWLKAESEDKKGGGKGR